MFQHVFDIRSRVRLAPWAVLRRRAQSLSARLLARLRTGRHASPIDALRPPAPDHSSAAPARICRLDVACDTRLRAQALIERLSPELCTHGVQVVRINLAGRGAATPCKLQLWVRCDGSRRAVLVRFVEHVGTLEGVRRVRWETVPNEAA
jgi:hypothetical protein